MTSHGHVTTASPKQASKEHIEGHFYPSASQEVLRIHP